jgi:hypothetical protein
MEGRADIKLSTAQQEQGNKKLPFSEPEQRKAGSWETEKVPCPWLWGRKVRWSICLALGDNHLLAFQGIKNRLPQSAQEEAILSVNVISLTILSIHLDFSAKLLVPFGRVKWGLSVLVQPRPNSPDGYDATWYQFQWNNQLVQFKLSDTWMDAIYTGVLKGRSSLRGQKKLKIFLCGMSTMLSTQVMRLKTFQQRARRPLPLL